MKVMLLLTIGILSILVFTACQPQAPITTPVVGLVETQVAATMAAQSAKMTAESEKLLSQATSTSLPTDTLEPSPTATATTEPSPTPSPTSAVAFRDDFGGKLADGWTWVEKTSNFGTCRPTRGSCVSP